jgi:indolepyruvate ferredoxin oxidoreductase, beta subunit
MDSFNIYLTGVGGQGIGLISEAVLRAADHAGLNVKSVDTHGLAQRGGIVVSQVRIGDGVFSPLIPAEEADLTIALERHEALRGMNTALKDEGTLVYYNTVQQPLEIRLNKSEETSETLVAEACKSRHIKEYKVFHPDLPDARMQNVVVLATVSRNNLIPSVSREHYQEALEDLLGGSALEKNMALFTELG